VARKKTDDLGPLEGETPPSASKQNRRFESALGEVEQIVGRLESGQLDLADALDQYQKGIETLKECHGLLAGAERRITLLSGFDADGNPVTTAFDQSDASLDAKQSRRSSRRGAAAADSPPVDTAGDDDDCPGLF
jgi:exodeoxyribonuclease VII small subunit